MDCTLTGPDIEKTAAFAPQTLSTAEHKYAAVEKEAFACVWAVDQWRTYCSCGDAASP